MEFECWFCGEGIEPSDPGAVVITIGNLWRSQSLSGFLRRHKNHPSQTIYAHTQCARDRMQGVTMGIDPDDFLD